MTILATDNFTRSNQSGLGTASDAANTWGTPIGSGTASISSNRGIFGNFNGDSHLICGSHSSTTDVNILAKFSSNDINFQQGGVLWRYTSASGGNGYRCGFGFGNEFIVSKYTNGTRSTVVDNFTSNFSANTDYWLRVIHTASGTLQIRWWLDGGSEPGNFSSPFVNQSETTFSSGNFGLSVGVTNGGTISYGSFTVTDNQTAATTVTKSVGFRLKLATKLTKSVGTRLKLKVQRTLSTPLRLVLRNVQTKSAPIRLKLAPRLTKSAPVRLILRNKQTATAALRFVLRNVPTVSTPLRLRLVVARSVSVTLRARIATRLSKSMPLRLILRALRTTSAPLRLVIRVLQSKSAPLRLRLTVKRSLLASTRFRLKTQQSLFASLRLVLRYPFQTAKLGTRLRIATQKQALCFLRLVLDDRTSGFIIPSLKPGSGFAGFSIVPLASPPFSPYTLNGLLLETQPSVMTAPVSTMQYVAAGAQFYLGFVNPTSGTSTLLTNGSIVTLRFGLSDRSSVTGRVQLQCVTTGSLLQVTCTVLDPIILSSRVILTQFF